MTDQVLAGSYDYRLAVLSVLIAILAPYTALDLGGRVTASRGRARLVWLIGGGTSMGIGIWSMCRDQIDAALRQKHREMFYGWLGVALARQTEDVAEYLARQADGQYPRVAETLQRWVQERSHEKLIPEVANESERELFSSDLRAILQLLQVRLGSAESV